MQKQGHKRRRLAALDPTLILNIIRLPRRAIYLVSRLRPDRPDKILTAYGAMRYYKFPDLNFKSGPIFLRPDARILGGRAGCMVVGFKRSWWDDPS